MMPEVENQPWRDIFYESSDGLRLHARHYPAPDEKLRSVICLPGLARNARDFHTLATYLSTHPEKPRNVYCLDYRGRGLSQHDRNWRNYVPYTELADITDFLTLQGLHRVGVVGTSRGGIIAMMMAALRPTAMSALVLNDIGPVIETRGLGRIVSYVGRTPIPKTWADAMMIMREINGRGFPNFTDAEWDHMARGIFEERKGRLALSYDRKLSRALGSIDLSRPVPDMWAQFAALGRVPLLVLRGEFSDVLSPETLELMSERHPNMRTLTVPDQGHTPVLQEQEPVETIGSFFAVND